MTKPQPPRETPSLEHETLDDLRREAKDLAGGEDGAPERMAIDNAAGSARPGYDQYALNDPESIDKPAQERAGAKDAGAGDAGDGHAGEEEE